MEGHGAFLGNQVARKYAKQSALPSTVWSDERSHLQGGRSRLTPSTVVMPPNLFTRPRALSCEALS